MHENRLKHPPNTLIVYLNINFLRNKIVDAKDVIGKLQLDYFVLSETKQDDSFPSAQCYIENFDIRNRRDTDNNGGGVRFIPKKIKEYEITVSETIASEFTMSKKKWFCLSVYRLPSSINVDIFFEELTKLSINMTTL